MPLSPVYIPPPPPPPTLPYSPFAIQSQEPWLALLKAKEKKRKEKKSQMILLWGWTSIRHMTLSSCVTVGNGESLSNTGIHIVCSWMSALQGGGRGDAWMSQALLGNLLIEGHSERGSPQRHVSRLMKLNYMVTEWRLGRKWGRVEQHTGWSSTGVEQKTKGRYIRSGKSIMGVRTYNIFHNGNN